MLWFFVPLAVFAMVGAIIVTLGTWLEAASGSKFWACCVIGMPIGALWGVAAGFIPSAIIFGISILAKIA